MTDRAANVSKKGIRKPDLKEPKEGKEPPEARRAASDAAPVPSHPKTGRMKRPKAKTGKRPVAREEPQQDLEPITQFHRGIPLGVKFGAAVISVIVLFTGLLGYLTYTIAARELDDQIMEQGISTASTLEKAVDRSLWLARPERAIKGAGGKEVFVDAIPREELLADWEDRLRKLVESSETIVHVGLIEIDEQNPLKQAATVQYPEQLAVSNITAVDVANTPGVRVQEARMGEFRVRRFDRRIDLRQDREKRVSELVAKLVELEPDPDQADEASKVKAELVTLTGVKDNATALDWQHWREQNPEAVPVDAWAQNGLAPPWVSVFVKANRLDELRAGLFKRIAAVTGCGALAAILFTVVITALLTGPIREIEQDVAEVARGNFEHQTRVRAKDEIGALAHVFNIMVRNLRIAQTNAAERKSFERELSIAKEIQEKLLPERIPQIPGYDIHNYYRAAKEVGGDYYDFIVIDQTHLGIIVADVAGKGIPGAMVMTMARSLVRLASVRNVSPADTFKKVNRILAKDIRRGMFVTAAYMVLNVKTRVLKIASAGHNPVVLWRAAKGENELIKPAGIALGFDKGTVFDNHVKEAEVQLEPGDRVVVYTDGVNEAMNDDSEEFGEERFFELSKQHGQKTSAEFVKAVVSALDSHRGGAEQSDDITIVTLAVQAGAATTNATTVGAGEAGDA